MGRSFVEVLTCDRASCGKEFKQKSSEKWNMKTISGLNYMVLHNGSGSSNSNQDDILCPECTTEFLNFLRG